jgi:hypothetical protein
MKLVLSDSVPIAQKSRRQNPANQPSAVAPIIDTRDKETEDKNCNGPTAHLPVDHLTKVSPSALPVVERGANETANGCRSAQRERDAREVGNQIAADAAESKDGDHPISAIFLKDKWGNLVECDHIEKYMEDASVEIVCGKERPPAVKFINRDASGSSQKQQTSVAGREKIEWVHGEPGRGRTHHHREDEHSTIQINDISDELITIEKASGEDIIPPPGPGIPQSTMRTGRLVNADESLAVGTQDRTSLLILHHHSGEKVQRVLPKEITRAFLSGALVHTLAVGLSRSYQGR